MKYLISVLLCFFTFISAISIIPFNAEAANIVKTSGNYKYHIIDNETVEITQYTGNDEKIVVPSEIDGKSVAGICYPFIGNENKNVKSVTLSEGIKYINTAFYNCPNLVEFHLCKSLKYVYYDFLNGTAIYNDKSNWDGKVLYYGGWIAGMDVTPESDGTLGTLTIKEGIKKICSLPDFYSGELNNGYTKINIPASVTSFPYKTLSKNQKNLTEVNVDKNNKRFSSRKGVLYDKRMTKLLCYPSKKKDEVYKTPQSLRQIKKYAFSLNQHLKRIVITKRVTSFPRGTLDLCIALQNVNVSKKNSKYASASGVLFNKTKSKLIKFPVSYPKKTYKIPKSVKKVCAASFMFSNIKKVIFNKNIKTIGSVAFYGCMELKTITLPKTIKKIGHEAFGWGYKYYEGVDPEDDVMELIYGVHFKFYKNSAGEDYYQYYMSQEDYRGIWSYKYLKQK